MYGLPKINKITFFPDKEYPNLIMAVDSSDILRTLSIMPLFSSKLVSILDKYDDFEFIKVEISNWDNSKLSDNYFLPRIKKYISCINKEKRTEDTFDDVSIIIKEKIPSTTLAFVTENYDFFYTEKFVKIIEDNMLDVDVYNLPYKDLSNS